MWEFLLECAWILWSFLKLVAIGVHSLFQDLYREHQVPTALPPQHGRVAIVTGGSSGIGFHVTKTLCELGMHVIIVDYPECTSHTDKDEASSNKKNIENSIQSIKKQVPDAVLEGFEVDLGSIKSVHKFAHQFKSRRLPLHILINNAGVMHIPYKKTVDGIEKQIAVNFMGHFLLSILLLPVLNVSGTNQLFARIVNVSSSTHRVGDIDLTTFTSKGAKPTRYSPYASYAQSKLAVIMGTYELARRLKAAKCFRVTVNSLHPGLVDSNLHSKAIFPAPFLRRIIGRFYKTPSQGADTVLYVALSPDLEKQTGGYYENCQKATSSKKSQSFQVQQAIWHTTCSVLNIDPHDLPSSRSHELMSSSGLAFSWHDDYINSPYQTNVDSPDKKTPVISPGKAVPTMMMGEERKKTSDSCVIDFAKDGEPSPHDRARSPLEISDSGSDKVSLQSLKNKSNLNANFDLEEKEIRSSGRRRSNSCSEPNKMENGQKQSNRPYRKKSAPHIFVSLYRSSQDQIQVPVQFDNIQCEEFMSTPTISNSSLDSIGSGKLRAVMCGNDVIYVPDEKENRPYNSATTSITSSPNASGSYISMEEGELNSADLPDDIPQMKTTRSGSLSHVIYLDESMLESLNYVPDTANEKSDFTFENETSPKALSSKLQSQNSPLNSQSMETSPPSSRSSLKSFPTTDPYSSPCISKDERQFDTDPDMIDEEMGDRSDNIPLCDQEYIDWKRQPLKSNSPHLRDSSDDEESEEWTLPSGLRPHEIQRRQTSPSISEDDEDDENDEEIRQERGRTMVRRSSRTRMPIQENFAKLDKEDYEMDDIPIHLQSSLSNITITLDDHNSSCSADSSPEKITPYQDNMILDFVNGVISESIKLVRSHAPDGQNTPGDKITNCKSVDEEIQTFIKEGDEKFQESKIFIPPTVVSGQEPKSTAFAQKGWDRLPHNVSDAELRAFAEHTILYNEMIRSGRVTPVKIQLDTVTEESVSEIDVNSNNSSPQVRSPNHEIPLASLSEEVPKAEPFSAHINQHPEHNHLDLSNYFNNESQSANVKILTNKFEERMLTAENILPSCPQNSSKSNSSDSDSSLVNGTEQPSQTIPRGLESRSSGEENTEETDKKEILSSSSDEKPDDDVENHYLPPGIGINQLFYSPHVSPAKDNNSEDMVFMFQLQPKNYEKASIIELDENDKSDANDILQGVPLLEDNDDEDDDDADPFDIPFGARQNYFQFKTKEDDNSQRFCEQPTETSIDNLTSNKNSEKHVKTSEPPPVAKKPVRHAQDTFVAEKLPAITKKPVRPTQDPPPIPKKPIVKPQSVSSIQDQNQTDIEGVVSKSESVNVGIVESTAKDTNDADISAINTEADSIAPKMLLNFSNSAQGSSINLSPMQDLFSQETSIKNLDPIREVNIALKETVEPVVEPASPVRQRSEPINDYANRPKTTDDTEMLASSLEKPITRSLLEETPSAQNGSVYPEQQQSNPVNDLAYPVGKISDPAKDQVNTEINVASLAKHFSSPVRQVSSPTKNLDSPVRQLSSPAKALDSPVRQVSSLTKNLDSPVKQVSSPAKALDSPVRQVSSLVKNFESPVRQVSSPAKDSPVKQVFSPVKDSPVRQISSPANDSPVKQVFNPAKDSSVRQISSPAKDSPVRQISSPVKDSTVRQISSPVKDSPVRQISSPAKNSPVRQVSSPAKDSPVRQVSSLAKDSPVRQISSSAKALDSPVRQVSSSAKNFDSPVRQVPSPAKDSPVRQVSSLAKDSPVRQVSSPAKDSPVRHVSSPAKDSPVRHVSSPAKDSPVRHVSSPAKDSPVRQVSSPAKDSPVRQVSSPVKDSPVRQVSSPAKDSPVRQVSSPAKDSPVRQVSSLAKDSPVRQVSSPANDSPVRQVSSLAINVDSPVRQVSSLTKNLDSPVRQVSSPAKNLDSPVRQLSSPAKNVDSPVRQVSSLAINLDSPVRQVSSPAKNVDSPVRQVSSPVKNVESAVRQVSSPVKNVDSPVGQVSSPVKSPADPVNLLSSSIDDSAFPERQVASPSKDVANSTEQTTTPTKDPTNPVMQVASPVKNEANTLQEGASSMEHVDSSVKQQPIPDSQISSSVMDHVNSDNQLNALESKNNSSAENISVSSEEPTFISTKQEKSTEQSEAESEHPDKSAECSQIHIHPSSDHSSSSSDTAGIDPRPESPDYNDLEAQAPLMSPAKRAMELCGEEKRLSVDLTDQTDLSEASNLSYAMAMSSIDSEECYFDSQPDAQGEDGDYAKIMASYKPICDQMQNSGNDDDETTSNGTLHSDIMSTHSEVKSDDDGSNNDSAAAAGDDKKPKDSHSNC